MKIVLKLRKLIHELFDLGILIKAFFGFFEILGGVLLAVSGQLVINNFIINLAQQEIADDPNDLIANFLINSANNFYYNAHLFAIIYLVLHGAINIFLAVALFKNKIWAYSWAIAGFSVFIIYQVYRYFHTHSFTFLLLTLFDVFIVFIIWLEYNRKKIKVNIEIPL
jgi:uncharacterized membrane protein